MRLAVLKSVKHCFKKYKLRLFYEVNTTNPIGSNFSINFRKLRLDIVAVTASKSIAYETESRKFIPSTLLYTLLVQGYIAVELRCQTA